MLDRMVADQVVDAVLLRVPREEHEPVLLALRLEEAIGRQRILGAEELDEPFAEDLCRGLCGKHDEEVNRPLLAHELPHPVEQRDRLSRRRELRPERPELVRDLPDPRAMDVLPQHLGPVLPVGLELALVRPPELGACDEAAERRVQPARRLVQSEADGFEPDRRRERRHLLGIVGRVGKPGARLHHSVVIGRH